MPKSCPEPIVAEGAAGPDGGVVRARIVGEARELFFRCGYRAFTMDDLAGELGMSKKTLYVHFRSKDAMVQAVLDGFAADVRATADALLAEPGMPFTEKLRRFASALIERLSRVTPAMLADLQRFAPGLHRHVEQLRAKNIPYVFGRFIEEGQAQGEVRADVNAAFAGEFYLHAMQGLMQPATLQRLRMAPDQTLDKALRLFFGGLFTPPGLKAYEKLFPA